MLVDFSHIWVVNIKLNSYVNVDQKEKLVRLFANTKRCEVFVVIE